MMRSWYISFRLYNEVEICMLMSPAILTGVIPSWYIRIITPSAAGGLTFGFCLASCVRDGSYNDRGLLTVSVISHCCQTMIITVVTLHSGKVCLSPYYLDMLCYFLIDYLNGNLLTCETEFHSCQQIGCKIATMKKGSAISF